MLKVLGVVLIVIVVLVVGAGFVLSSEYVVDRTITVNATTEKIHEYVGDLKKWPEWMPWWSQDPTIETTYGEQSSGVGASQSWTGEEGGGEITVTRSDVGTGIEYDMVFIMGEEKLPSLGAVRYARADGGVEITWRMEGDMGGGVFGGYLAMLVKGSIESSFDDGLQRLKGLAEGG